MARRFKSPISRKGDVFRVNLEASEIEILIRMLAEMRTLLLGESTDERLQRVFPAAYHQPEDRERDAEYQRLMREELVASRLSGIATVEGALAPVEMGRKAIPELSENQLLAFMQAINGLRLVLGTILDVSEEHDLDQVADDHPRVGEYHLYGYLSWILEASVSALQG